MFTWIKQYGIPTEKRVQQQDYGAEVKRLQAQLKRVTEERDILKKSRSVLCQGIRVRYAFIRDHESQYAVRTTESRRLLGQIKQCWIQRGTVSGYRKISDDLLDMGARCGEQRVRRLMKANRGAFAYRVSTQKTSALEWSARERCA